MSSATPIVRDSRQRDIVAAVGQAVFNFPSFLVDTLDLAIYKCVAPSATYVLVTSGFSIALNVGGFGATVTFATAPRASAGDPNVTIRLSGKRVGNRVTDVTRGGALSSALLERELDAVELTLQELRRDVDAEVELLASTSAAADASTRALSACLRTPDLSAIGELPSVTSRAGLLLGFDAGGNPVPYPPPQSPSSPTLRTLFVSPDDYGLPLDDSQDAWPALQAAVAASQSTGLPVGLRQRRYKLISQNATLDLTGASIVSLAPPGVFGSSPLVGAQIDIYYSAGRAITIGKGGRVQGVSFYYPNQTERSLTVYPALFDLRKAVDFVIDDITVYNCWDCFELGGTGAGEVCGRGRIGNPRVFSLNNDIVARSCPDIVDIFGGFFSPGLWETVVNQPQTITNISNNGSGKIRVTVPAHGFIAGDKIRVEGVTTTTEANGLWTIAYVDANNFDLSTAVYSGAASAFVTAWAGGGGKVRPGNAVWRRASSGSNVYVDAASGAWPAVDGLRIGGFVFGARYGINVNSGLFDVSNVVDYECDATQTILAVQANGKISGNRFTALGYCYDYANASSAVRPANSAVALISTVSGATLDLYLDVWVQSCSGGFLLVAGSAPCIIRGAIGGSYFGTAAGAGQVDAIGVTNANADVHLSRVYAHPLAPGLAMGVHITAGTVRIDELAATGCYDAILMDGGSLYVATARAKSITHSNAEWRGGTLVVRHWDYESDASRIGNGSPVVKAHMATYPTFNSATWTTVVFDVLDADGMKAYSTATGVTTVAVAAFYRVRARINGSFTAGDTWGIRININSAAYLISYVMVKATDQLIIDDSFYCAAGSAVSIEVSRNGGAGNLVPLANATTSTFELTMVS